MYDLLTLIYEFFEIAGIILCINLLYCKHYKFRVHDVVFAAFDLILLESVNRLGLNKEFTFLLYIALFIYAMTKFKARIKSALVHVILCIIVMVILQLVCSIPVALIESFLPIEGLLMIANALAIGILLLLGKKQKLYQLSRYASEKDWLFIAALVLCLIGVVYLLITYKISTYLGWDDYLIMGLSLVLISALTVQWQKVRMENIVNRKEMEIKHAYDKVYQELIASIRRKQHEFDNHIHAIEGQHRNASSFEELVKRQQEYCDEMKYRNRYNKLLSGGSPLIVGFLYSKFLDAEKRGISVDYKITTEDLACSIPSYQMVEIMGCFVDNAVEAVENKENAKIFVEMTEYTDCIHILVRNVFPFVEQEEIHNFLQPGYSTKGENRGLGLPNVFDILSKYGCELAIYNKKLMDENWIVLETKIDK